MIETTLSPAIDFGLPSDRGGKDLGVFLPMANGGWILSTNTPTLDGSYAYNRQVAELTEQHGLDFIMAMAKWRGYGGVTEHWRYSLESQMLMASLATVTSRVKVWATVHTLLQNPAVTAKMIATLDHISQGRAGLNVVTGSYKDEFAQMGAWRDEVGHDARYDLGAEWIEVIKRLWSEPAVHFDGQYFHMDDCQSDPKPISRPRPFLVCAGTSPKGMQFTIDHMDAIFLGGSDLDDLARKSRMAKEMATASGRKIKTYTMINLVIGDTDEQAAAQAEHYREGFDEGAFHGMLRAYGFLDAEVGKENAFTRKARSGFISEHVAGSAETVGTHLMKILDDCDLDGLMLIFPDYLHGIPLFAHSILPRIRARFPHGHTP
ncbi:LLM class flavin-dependent oxidoreductase [Pseudoxanthomonas winnipegensis]|uniref:LLM class flavin-dependent oxidoreductase n=1 Tax=Pseudoxanthomonas winnipegensis TaxID=2480810 RepID=UPI00103ADC04|nr:LLM class flavin-dependent oxidoreductase [Pseudoxanthomonas winnipegensis]TBV72414.1 LLM class flavin-dependent oxidoreductase [Pseudoxanthomonas winnipegensis]